MIYLYDAHIFVRASAEGVSYTQIRLGANFSRGDPFGFWVPLDGLQPQPVLAPQPDKGTYSKGSLIVNLSAYGGIAVERGLGLIRESLEEEDIVKILAASTLLMAAITRQPIDWSQRQPR